MTFHAAHSTVTYTQCHNLLSFSSQPLNRETSFGDTATVGIGSITAPTGKMLLPDLVDQPPFLLKLRFIVDDPKYTHAIGWSDDGASVVIRNEEALVKSVLPAFFKTRQLPSFIRQLHLYGFTKANGYTKAVNGRRPDLMFHNENFQRDKPELMKHIKREPTKGKRPNIRPMPPMVSSATQETGRLPNSPSSSDPDSEQVPHGRAPRLTIVIPESDFRQWTDYRSPQSDPISPRSISDLISPRSESISPRGDMPIRSPSSGQGLGVVNWPLDFYEGGARLLHTRRKSTPYDRAAERAAQAESITGQHHHHVHTFDNAATMCTSCGCHSSFYGEVLRKTGSPETPRRTSSLPVDGSGWRGLAIPGATTERSGHSTRQSIYDKDEGQEDSVPVVPYSQSLGLHPDPSYVNPTGRRLSEEYQYSHFKTEPEQETAPSGHVQNAVILNQWQSSNDRGHVDPLAWYGDKHTHTHDVLASDGELDKYSQREQNLQRLQQEMDGVVWRPF